MSKVRIGCVGHLIRMGLAFSAVFADAQIEVGGSATHTQSYSAVNTLEDYQTPIGFNRKMVVTVSLEGNASITNISYGDQALTEVITAANGSSRKSSIWYLDAPAMGTRDLTVSFSAPASSIIGVASLENAASGPAAQTASATWTTTLGLTTTSDDALVVGVYTSNGGVAPSSTFSGTIYSVSAAATGHSGYQNESDAGAKSYTWTAANNAPVAVLAAFEYEKSTITFDPEVIDVVLADTPNRQKQKHLLTMTKTPPKIGAQEYALSAYWLNNPTQMATADTELIKLKTDGWYDAQMTGSGDPFHWNAFVQARIYLLYSSQSTYFPGRMSPAAENAILDMLWGWASNRCVIGMFDPDTTFYSWGSENHHSMAWIGYWSIAQIMAGHPVHSTRPYADGTTPAAMAAAANEYYKAYVRHRTLNAPMIEAAAPAYNTITMNTWLSLPDFATDPELKAAASSLIDIYWANWAIEQINGVRGGSRNRCKPGREAVARSASEDVAWNFFGIGNEPYAIAGAVGATTLWRPSRAVVALALDLEGRGEYGYISRRLGHRDPNPMPVLAGPTEFRWNPLNPEGGHLLRYTWTTPDFVMGTAMMSKLPSSSWIEFSSQDRWNGTIFKGPNTSRIFTQVPYNQNDQSVYNTEWGVQNKGVSILQRIPTDVDADGQMVWFSLDLNRRESNDWIFAEALDAFAAVKIVDGNWTWTPDGDQFQRNDIPDNIGEWAVLNDEYCPIIMEVACKEDYNGSMSRFMQDILDNTLTWTNKKLDYTSTGYGTKLTLFTDYRALPQVDGVTIDLAPPEAYRSPYLNGDVAEGPVIIQYGDDRTIHGVAPFADDADTLYHWNFDTTIPTVSAASTDSVEVVSGKFGDGYRCNYEEGEQLIMTGLKWPSNRGTFRYQGWFRLGSGDTGGYLFHVYNQVYLSVTASTATFKINKSGVATDNSWSNVVVVAADIGTDNEWQYLEAYYDGSTIKLVTEEETVTAPGIGAFVPNPLYATKPVYIGSRLNNNNYVGEMDELKISSVPVLSAGLDDMDADGMGDAWEMEHFGSLGTSDGAGDADHDGFTDAQESIAATDPWDATSLLEITGFDGGTNLFWKAVQGKYYRVLSATNLTAGAWAEEASDIPGTPPESRYSLNNDAQQLYFKIETE